MLSGKKRFNKNILIAVDESENARRAVSYVGRLLAGIGGFKILILHVIRQPDEDFFPTATEKDTWLSVSLLDGSSAWLPSVAIERVNTGLAK